MAARSAGKLNPLKAELGERAHVVVGDVADPGDCALIVREALDAMGGLDVMIYTAGAIGLTRALAAEMAPNVRVNAISPGPVDTPMLRSEIELFGGTPEVVERAIARVPLKRLAQPEEIARSILYLAVDAKYAAGTTLRLDGGTTMV